MNYVCGLDIGYGNLKITHGEKASPPASSLSIPANAGPASRMPYTLGEDKPHQEIRILVDEEQWVAGVEPGKLQSWTKELHSSYTESQSYKALFFAGLALMPIDHVNLLVTGLPVSLFKNPSVKEKLVNMMTGEHSISAKRKVVVEQVIVLPQPAGAFMDLTRNFDNERLIEQGKAVVIDSGFFSVDYVSIDKGAIRDASSGSSKKAMSVILKKTSELIAEDIGCGPGVDRLEVAVQNGDQSVFASGREVIIKEYLNKASELVAGEALVEVRKDMRQDNDNVDILLLTGGGAQYYSNAAKKVFNECANVVTSKNSHLANSRGFFEYGCLLV